jgi:hypothetical protein
MMRAFELRKNRTIAAHKISKNDFDQKMATVMTRCNKCDATDAIEEYRAAKWRGILRREWILRCGVVRPRPDNEHVRKLTKWGE